MVVDDPPAGSGAAKQQGEQTRTCLLGAIKPPTTKGQCRVRSQDKVDALLLERGAGVAEAASLDLAR